MILGTLTSTFFNFDEIEISFLSSKLFCLFIIFVWRSFFIVQWAMGQVKEEILRKNTEKLFVFFEKKTFQLLICFLQVRVYVSSFFSDLNFELFELMFLVFFQMLPFILWMQKIKSHSLYIWKFIWNEILFFLWAHFWLWNNFFYKHFFFLHSHYW